MPSVLCGEFEIFNRELWAFAYVQHATYISSVENCGYFVVQWHGNANKYPPPNRRRATIGKKVREENKANASKKEDIYSCI